MALETPPEPFPSSALPTRARRSTRGWAVGCALIAVALGGAGVATHPRAAAVWASEAWTSAPWTAGPARSAVRAAVARQLVADSVAAAMPLVAAGDATHDEPTTGAQTVEASAVEAQAAVRAFYAARGGAPAWTDAKARKAALQLLARADRDAVPVADALPSGLLALASATSPEATDSLHAALDVRLSGAVLRFGRLLRQPRTDAAALYGASAWTPAVRPARDLAAEARALAAALVGATDPAGALGVFVGSQRPPHEGYARLQTALAREMDLAERADLILPTDISPADSGATIRRLRVRLAVEAPGLAPRVGFGTVAPDLFDAALGAALRRYQRGQGLPSTGIADSLTRAALNRRRPEAIPALALNLERWRWLPDSLGPLHVAVNIPSFEMVVRERRTSGWAEVFRSAVVVGKPSWATPVFSDTIESVVFNPTWTMPRSIQIESYGRLRPERAVVAPGPRNALGRVKFLFPNRHAVYVHDTPSRWGFTAERRALSHGCIRSGDPQGLARVLLPRAAAGWNVARVDSLMTGPWATREAFLDRPVPVHIVYFTAEADAAGRVTLYDDVYGRDARLAEALGGGGATPSAATHVAGARLARRDRATGSLVSAG